MPALEIVCRGCGSTYKTRAISGKTACRRCGKQRKLRVDELEMLIGRPSLPAALQDDDAPLAPPPAPGPVQRAPRHAPASTWTPRPALPSLLQRAIAAQREPAIPPRAPAPAAPLRARPQPAPARAPAGSPWAVGRDTDQALAKLGLGPTVRVGPGECAMWDSRLGTPCPGQAASRAVFSRAAHLPVCKACGRAIDSRAQDRGQDVAVTTIERGV